MPDHSLYSRDMQSLIRHLCAAEASEPARDAFLRRLSRIGGGPDSAEPKAPAPTGDRHPRRTERNPDR